MPGDGNTLFGVLISFYQNKMVAFQMVPISLLYLEFAIRN